MSEFVCIGDLIVNWHYFHETAQNTAKSRSAYQMNWTGGACYGLVGSIARLFSCLGIEAELSTYSLGNRNFYPSDIPLTTKTALANVERQITENSLPTFGYRITKMPKYKKEDKEEKKSAPVLRVEEGLGWSFADQPKYSKAIRELTKQVLTADKQDKLLILSDGAWGFCDEYFAPTCFSIRSALTLATEGGFVHNTNTPLIILTRPVLPIEFEIKGNSRTSIASRRVNKKRRRKLKLEPNTWLIVEATDLRTYELNVSRGISWERTVQHLIVAAIRNFSEAPGILGLATAENVIVRFGRDGLVWLARTENNVTATLIFHSHVIEGEGERIYPGRTYGFSSALATILALGLQKGLDTTLVLKLCLQFLRSQAELDYRHEDNPNPLLSCGDALFGSGKAPLTWSVSKITHFATLDEKSLRAALRIQKADTEIHSISVTYKQLETNKRRLDGTQDINFRSSWWSYLSQNFATPHDAYLFAKDLVTGNFNNTESSFPCINGQHFPYAKFKKLITIDREEIESFRNLGSIIEEYYRQTAFNPPILDKPLNIAVFGQPGSGKSFGVKQLIESLQIGHDVVFLTFNLSGFSSTDALLPCFQAVQDEVLAGKFPVVFWDEYDTTLNGEPFGWLHSFLAPMQDGKFFYNHRENPIGRCIFVFAGSRFNRFEDLPDPRVSPERPFQTVITLSKREAEEIGSSGPGLIPTVGDVDAENLRRRREHWRIAKGSDFRSRLKGVLNVREANLEVSTEDAGDRRGAAIPFSKDNPKTCDQANFLIRRAQQIRSELLRNYPELKFEDQQHRSQLRIAAPVVNGFLCPVPFKHGSRSIESVIHQSELYGRSRFDKSALPPSELLSIHVDPACFDNSEDVFEDDVNFKAMYEAHSLPGTMNDKVVEIDSASHVPTGKDYAILEYKVVPHSSITNIGEKSRITKEIDTFASITEYQILVGPYTATNPEDYDHVAWDRESPYAFSPPPGEGAWKIVIRAKTLDTFTELSSPKIVNRDVNGTLTLS